MTDTDQTTTVETDVDDVTLTAPTMRVLRRVLVHQLPGDVVSRGRLIDEIVVDARAGIAVELRAAERRGVASARLAAATEETTSDASADYVRDPRPSPELVEQLRGTVQGRLAFEGVVQAHHFAGRVVEGILPIVLSAVEVADSRGYARGVTETAAGERDDEPTRDPGPEEPVEESDVDARIRCAKAAREILGSRGLASSGGVDVSPVLMLARWLVNGDPDRGLVDAVIEDEPTPGEEGAYVAGCRYGLAQYRDAVSTELDGLPGSALNRAFAQAKPEAILARADARIPGGIDPDDYPTREG